MTQFDIADLHDAKQWQNAKKKRYILQVIDETEEDCDLPIPSLPNHILTIIGNDMDDVLYRLGGVERKMEKVLSNHIEA